MLSASSLRRGDVVRVRLSERFEAALVRAEARVGIIPSSVVPAIESQCRAELFDIEALARTSALAGNSAIPLIKELTVLVEGAHKDAGQYIHYGATSQYNDPGYLADAFSKITASLDATAKVCDASDPLIEANVP